MTVLSLMRRLDAASSTDDAKEGRRLQAQAIKAAHDHAHPEWLALMEQCIRHCAQYLGEWTNDDVFAEFDQRAEAMRALGVGPPTTHEPRALGAVTRKLARAGLMEKTGRYVTSTRKTNHAQPIPVWRRTQ